MGIPVELCGPDPWDIAGHLCCDDPADPVDCETGLPVPLVFPWTDAEIIEAATGILYRQTCRLFPGYCTVTVRPCGYCSCGHSRCGCGRYVFVDLQDRYPVISVDEVLVDGVIVPPASYRVDDYHRLVRTDGDCWPACNDLTLDDSEPNTFAVTYTAGRVPPVELRMAAAELACEMKRACNGGDCRLPRNVTSVNRQGVTMNIDALEASVNGGRTGIPGVDLAVARYDCNRQKARVWHPSLRLPRGVFPS